MIVIPMAGLSRRFAEVGYVKPKYMLPLRGCSVFAHAVESFAAYFKTQPFLFIARDIEDTSTFILDECKTLGIDDARVVILNAPTAGQAETVECGLSQANIADAESLTIFNIDTFRPGYRFPNFPWWSNSDGYLEVFRGEGMNWSYVRSAPGQEEPLVLETAEKRPLSDLCCTGLYHFARAGDFRNALQEERQQPTAPELYVAPLYNHLIRLGRRIHFDIIPFSEVVFCGVPSEYQALIATPG